MDSVAGIHFTTFAAKYDTILAQTQESVAGFPPLLRDLAMSTLPQLAAGSFSRMVASLLYWVADLLEERVSTPQQKLRLGLANLLG